MARMNLLTGWDKYVSNKRGQENVSNSYEDYDHNMLLREYDNKLNELKSLDDKNVSRSKQLREELLEIGDRLIEKTGRTV